MNRKSFIQKAAGAVAAMTAGAIATVETKADNVEAEIALRLLNQLDALRKASETFIYTRTQHPMWTTRRRELLAQIRLTDSLTRDLLGDKEFEP